MSISTGGGLVSGIPTQDLINQLLQLEARPRVLMQNRIIQLQSQQAAYLDLNSRVGALRSASQAFRTSNVFGTMSASSSNADVLSATASIGAPEGSYTFSVDRLVTTQQMLTKGFADRDSTGLGATTFTVESAEGRVDADARLSDLNGGAGVQRGNFRITQGGQSVTIDATKAANISEVVDAINDAGLDVSASLVDGSLRLSTTAGGDSFTVSEDGGSTAADLGILGTSADSGGAEVLEGARLLRLSADTALSTLNDGNGVFTNNNFSETRSDFRIDVDGTVVEVSIGPIFEIIDGDLTETERAVGTVGGVIDRINAALADKGISGVEAEINADGTGLQIRDTTGAGRTIGVLNRVGASSTESTLRDLGFADGDSAAGTLGGSRVLGGLGTTLTKNLNGGSGISGNLDVIARDGNIFSIDLSNAETVDEIIETINNDPGASGRIVASLNDSGNGIKITDITGGTANPLGLGGSAGEALGIAGAYEDGVGIGNAQRAYVTAATLLSDFNDGNAFSDGEIRIRDGSGLSITVNVGEDTTTVGQLIEEINNQADAAGVRIIAEINENGDGIAIREDLSGGAVQGGVAISVEDETGNIASRLGIAGQASGVGTENFIDGSRETVIELEATDTLEQIVQKLNAAGAGVTASIINDGASGTPFRISLTSRDSGEEGRFILDTGGLDLGLSTLDEGNDARVFFGSTNPATAVLLTSSTNTLDGVISGVNIDLQSTSDDPVTVNVRGDTEAIETSVGAFVQTFNDLVARIDQLTDYDDETESRGVLLGDQTVLSLRRALFNAVQAPPDGFSGTFTRLTQVGISVGEGGTLEFDADEFRQALAQDPEGVEELFTRRDLENPGRETPLFNSEGEEIGSFVNNDAQNSFSALGIIGKVEELADRYASAAGGVLTERRNTFDTQIQFQQDRIADFNVRLDARRQILETQFLTMERTIGLLQSQQSTLAGIQGLG